MLYLKGCKKGTLMGQITNKKHNGRLKLNHINNYIQYKRTTVKGGNCQNGSKSMTQSYTVSKGLTYTSICGKF